MNRKLIGKLLFSLSSILLLPSLALAHAGHGEHPDYLHWMDHFGDLGAYLAGAGIWIVPAAMICGALYLSVVKVSNSVKG